MKSDLLRTLAGFFLVCFSCLFLEEAGADQIDNTINEFFQNLKAGKMEKSYALTTETFQQATSLKQFEEYVKDFPFLADHKTLDIQNKDNDRVNAVLEVILDKEFNPKSIKFKLKQEQGHWKINDFELENSLEQAPMVDARVLFNIALSQIQFLKQDKVEEAYQLFSEDFKNKLSLQDFRSLLKRYPVFSDYKSFEIQNPLLKNNQGSFFLVLKNENEFYIFEYVLISEKGSWRIASLKFIQQGRLSGSDSNQPPSQFAKKAEELQSTGFNIEPLKETLTAFLNSLKQQKIEKAYQDYTTQAFKKKTDFNIFQAFVKKHSILTSFQSYQWKNLNIDNNTAQFFLDLIDSEKKSHSIRMDLTKEGQSWKIQDLEAESKEDVEPLETGQKVVDQNSKGMQFTQVRVGYQVDTNGLVKESKSLLQAHSTQVMYINLYVSEGKKGSVVRLLVKNLQTDEFIPPVSTTLNGDGESIITFAFSAPPQGWPAGTYELKASSDNLSRVFNFKME